MCNHPKIGILFSGGIDCTIIALLADRFVPKDIPINLLNVAFEKIIRPVNLKPNKLTVDSEATEINWEVPDRITGRSSLNELQRLIPHR